MSKTYTSIIQLEIKNWDWVKSFR